MQNAPSHRLNPYLDYVLAFLGAVIAVYICLPISKDGDAYLYFYQDASNYGSTEYLFWIWLDIGDHLSMSLPDILLPLLFITLLLKLKAFRQLGANTLYLYPVYLSIFYLLHEGTQLRISCALAFSLWACFFSMRRQWYLTIFLTCIAVGFHITSPLLPIVFTLCYYFKNIRNLAWWFLGLGMLIYAAHISVIEIVTGQFAALLGGRYTIYADSLLDDQNTSGLVFVYAFLLAALLVFLAAWGRNKLHVLPKTYPAMLATSVYGCAVLFWLHETTAAASRMSDVLAITVVPLLAIVIARVSLPFQLASVVLLGGFFYMRLFQLF
jgi:EpsG family